MVGSGRHLLLFSDSMGCHSSPVHSELNKLRGSKVRELAQVVALQGWGLDLVLLEPSSRFLRQSLVCPRP